MKKPKLSPEEKAIIRQEKWQKWFLKNARKCSMAVMEPRCNFTPEELKKLLELIRSDD
jgi:hypothetical protein